MSARESLQRALGPLRARPRAAAVLLDVDGTLAPIVARAEDATVPRPVRDLLADLADRYGMVACVSGRRAQDARRLVGLDELHYVGTHGAERLAPGTDRAEMDADVAAGAQQVHAFVALQHAELGDVGLEDKGPIVALHWREAADGDNVRRRLEGVAAHARAAGLEVHWGRKVLELRPGGVSFDKGAGVRRLLDGSALDAALYAGDDRTDLDAWAGLDALVEAGALQHAVRVGVVSDEGPAEIADRADVTVEGTDGVAELLGAL